MHTNLLSERQKGTDNLGDLGEGESVILEWILKKQRVR
jgi:hypothetical protein